MEVSAIFVTMTILVFKFMNLINLCKISLIFPVSITKTTLPIVMEVSYYDDFSLKDLGAKFIYVKFLLFSQYQQQGQHHQQLWKFLPFLLL